MKAISLRISTSDYQALKKAARLQHRPVAQVIREALDFYRREKLSSRSSLREVPVLVGHKVREEAVVDRQGVYDEVFNPERK